MTDFLLAALDEAFDARSWHGTNLRGSLRGLDVAVLSWRPGPDRHNIWELAVHAAYWKYAVRRKLTGEKRGSFALEGSNFWKRPVEKTTAAWKRDLALLDAEHLALRDAVASFAETTWSRRPKGGRFTYAGMVRGVAAHDLYHAGQILLLKRLQQ
ncbi:MAG: DinB family protein [Vicinamibacterales bacterium]